MSPMLAWIPFVQPAPGVAHLWWLLVVPLSILLSMIWRSIRTANLADYWPSVARMSAQIVLGMVALFAVLAVLIRVALPHLPAE